MENIYKECLAKVEAGARFRINFETRCLVLNGKHIIKDGKYDGDLGLEPQPLSVVLSEIEGLYRRYRYSIPSEISDSRRKTYFQAIPEHELSDDDMLYGERREYAQAALELYVLCSILNGSLVWDDFAKDKWFWKSPNEDSLIILKQWITKNTKENEEK